MPNMSSWKFFSFFIKNSTIGLKFRLLRSNLNYLVDNILFYQRLIQLFLDHTNFLKINLRILVILFTEATLAYHLEFFSDTRVSFETIYSRKNIKYCTVHRFSEPLFFPLLRINFPDSLLIGLRSIWSA